MRFLIRLVVLGLAAVGAKTVYDWLATRREDVQRTGSDLAGRTTTAVRAVAHQATDAARRVADVVQESASGIADTAAEQAREVQAAAVDARDEALEELKAPRSASDTETAAAS